MTKPGLLSLEIINRFIDNMLPILRALRFLDDKKNIFETSSQIYRQTSEKMHSTLYTILILAVIIQLTHAAW